ncbi:single-stranded DNA-binding protein [Alicyclobacillus fastidiosus]|uniref:Single-stranded DNA-binding protein n=1 Tax=Alicyclobacillus fastidiosus TaxID=392011 RepID=A0ABY6ZGH9_9BACL|nr:single-stranded DNA-binding protein [Alicyclobacillus fastidiosus]WAH41941.1 single-stranded DNA-binding protein [Alicyclobacillus fastidiosus]GMA63664.1 single-stranded DNA-binding protein A [Alicyclobacillus fastidiosus]
MLNRVILIGRLTADPELRYTNSGTPVASFTLAVDRMRSGQAGERQTDFINIVVWQKQAEIVSQYLQKGRLAAVDGRLQIRTYDNREGQKVRIAEVVAESVRFLDRGSDAQQGGSYGGGAPSISANRPARPERGSAPLYEDDPFADDSQTIDISEDDLPF